MTAPDTREQSSFAEDVIDTYIAPAAMFARRRAGSPWGAFFLVAIVLGALFVFNSGPMQGVTDAEVARILAQAQEQNPNLNAEQLEQSRKGIEISLKYGPLLGIPMLLLALGLGVWLVGRLFSAELGYGGALMIASFSYLPRVLEAALVAVQALLMDVSAIRGRYQLSFGVGRFLDPDGNQGLLQLLGRVDVFTIWTTVLIALGFIYVGKLEKSKGYTAAVVVYVLGALPALWTLITTS